MVQFNGDFPSVGSLFVFSLIYADARFSGFQATFALVLLFQAWILPDSPRWLLAHGRESEAVNVLARLADEPEDSHKVLKQRDEIASSIELESSGGESRYAKLQGVILRNTVCRALQIC
jgi:Sugar (and other) transporter